jgi:uncharacterized membrane protein YcgQ (UPF0703/DUF1980 family)
MKQMYISLMVFVFFITSCGRTAFKAEAALLSLDEGVQTEVPAYSAGAEVPITPATPRPETPGKIIEIKEKLFIAQTNDVYLNPEDYLGKTIKLEGLFKQEQGTDKSYCFVLRYGPGCCGYDGNAGFEVAWDKDAPYPAADEWVEAMGVLKSYEEDGYPYLYLALSSLIIKDERGAEFVSQ